MKRLSKRFKKYLQVVEKERLYTLQEAVNMFKDLPHPRFDETVEVACSLNIDPKQPEQMARGGVVLPHGIGKEVKICAFCKGEDIKKAQEAGADFAGSTELIEKVKQGWLEFDKACSSAEMMKEVAQLGRFLGPRGMMPSQKTATVGPDIAWIVKDLKGGKVQFKTDKTGNIHAVVGRISFSVQALCENAKILIKAILASRPASVKGRFIKNLCMTTSMGPSVRLDTAKLEV